MGKPKYARFFIKSLKVTELVSRVLYSCEQPSSIFTANCSAVQAKSSATMSIGTGSPQQTLNSRCCIG